MKSDQATTVLDVGGWFKPHPLATHVVDLMPWETREAALNLKRKPHEHFDRHTWHQVNFLDQNLRLPFQDRQFDFCYCGQTIEDLKDPMPILAEMRRVARSGRIECPSRLAEQTRGIRDRMTRGIGHPHHYWIMEVEAGALALYSKADSFPAHHRAAVPLSVYERAALGNPRAALSILEWQDDFRVKIVQGEACARRAAQFACELRISSLENAKDGALRAARRARQIIKRGTAREDFGWWPKIVELSRPYSSIKL
jgi:SAM-dependent methyltransferase